jgi:hypothetical protein
MDSVPRTHRHTKVRATRKGIRSKELTSLPTSPATDRRLNKVKRIVEQAGLHVRRLYEKEDREFVVIISDDGLEGEQQELYELGLTVTSIHLSKTDKYKDKKNGKEYGYIELYLTDKEGVKSVWFPPKYNKCLWTECEIYLDLEIDAAQCMLSHIPLLYEPSVDNVVKFLKYLQEKGYSKFYQAVRYRGLFGQYDYTNYYSLCTICKQGLLCNNEKRGDLPLVMSYVDGTIGIKSSPVVVYVVCYGCYKRYYQREETIPMGVIRKEVHFMLHSKGTRWIQNNQLAESPFLDLSGND